MKKLVLAALALFGPALGWAQAACDAAPSASASLQSADAVADYESTLQLCKGGGAEQLAIRRMTLGGEPALLLADPRTLATRLQRAACWSCADVKEADLASTRMMRAIVRAAQAPGLVHRGFLANAGLTRGERGGGYFTGDLCPSSKPMDRDFLATLEGRSEPTPIALSISGLWLKHHFADFRWLMDRQSQGAFAITWINHTCAHPFRKGLAEGANFLLLPGVDPDYEILETERLLIANGGTPSLFFRFPGLVSSSPLKLAVREHHLISLGTDAWLALNQAPRDGSIMLVHPNGNEERGLKIYQRDASEKKLPMPLKPLDEAPE